MGTLVTRARHCVRILEELTSVVRFYFTFTPKHMSDVYAQKPLSHIPITILGRQMDALRAYVRTVETVGGLPSYGGWEDIPKFSPRGGDLGE